MELSWWTQHLSRCNGKTLLRRKPDLILAGELSGSSHRRPLGSHREDHAHKLLLLGAFGSDTGSEDFHKRSDKQECPTVLRQYYSSGIYKSSRRDSVPASYSPSKGAMDVVLVERHDLGSSTLTRERKCDS